MEKQIKARYNDDILHEAMGRYDIADGQIRQLGGFESFIYEKEIPHFLKLREIDLYAVIHRSFGESYVDDPWCARYMDNRKHKIENDVPYIDFDFESLRNQNEKVK